MRMVKCDKCEASIDDKTGSYTISISKFYSGPNVDSGHFYRADLCENCYNKLREFVGK